MPAWAVSGSMPAWSVSGPVLAGLLTVKCPMPALAFHSQLSNDSFYEKLRKIQYCFKESSSKETHDDNDADV